MRYVAAILLIGFVVFLFATCGFRELGREPETAEETALQLDHIADDLRDTRDIERCILLLENKANSLRQNRRR